MGWGNSWDDKITNDTTNEAKKSINELIDKVMPHIGFDLGTGDHAVETTFEDGQIKQRVIPPEELYITEAAPIKEKAWNNLKKYLNKQPTHDPYTNPNATIYYECGCGAILDPQTKSFAALNNYASEKGWKIRFGADSYVPYCVKCGENVE